MRNDTNEASELLVTVVEVDKQFRNAVGTFFPLTREIGLSFPTEGFQLRRRETLPYSVEYMTEDEHSWMAQWVECLPMIRGVHSTKPTLHWVSKSGPLTICRCDQINVTIPGVVDQSTNMANKLHACCS